MEKKKLLIVSASTGSGHARAADAVKKTAELAYPEFDVKHIDFFDYMNSTMKAALVGSYDLMVMQAPDLWGFVYNATNQPSVSSGLQKMTKTIKHITSSEFAQEIRTFGPDYILFTHMFPADMYIGLVEKKKLPFISHGTVITDYGLHEMWITHLNQQFFVASEKIRWQLCDRGVKEEHVIVSGIPIDPVFYKKKSAAALKKKLKYKEHEQIILCLSGGQGLVRLDDIVKTIAQRNEPATIITVSGNNASLYEKLKKMKLPAHIRFSPLRWVDNIDEYIRIANVVITKLGGMTTTECIALGTPIIGIDPIPGQEESNTEFVLEHHLGHSARTHDDLLYYLSHIEPPRPYPLKKSANIILSTIKNILKNNRAQ